MIKEEVLVVCSNCHQKKAYWNTRKKVGYCHRCQKKIDQLQYSNSATTLAPPPSVGLDIYLNEIEVKTFRYDAEISYYIESLKAFHLVEYEMWKSAFDWLVAKNLFMDDEYPFSFSVHDNRIWFPLSMQRGNAVRGWMGRTLNGNSIKWIFKGGAPKSLFHYVKYSSYYLATNLDYDIQGEKIRYVLLTEGIADALTKGLENTFVLATLGTTISDSVAAYIANLNLPVVIWFDPDIAGKLGAIKVVNKLKAMGCKTYNINTAKEPNDCTEEEIYLHLMELTLK